MSQAYISARCKQILYMIIDSDDFVTLSQITEELHLSKRSIYYEICKINDWLSEAGNRRNRNCPRKRHQAGRN